MGAKDYSKVMTREDAIEAAIEVLSDEEQMGQNQDFTVQEAREWAEKELNKIGKRVRLDGPVIEALAMEKFMAEASDDQPEAAAVERGLNGESLGAFEKCTPAEASGFVRRDSIRYVFVWTSIAGSTGAYTRVEKDAILRTIAGLTEGAPMQYRWAFPETDAIYIG